MTRLAMLCLLATAACAHKAGGLIDLDVRSSTTGKGRAFEFDPRKGELVAYTSAGRLLQIWVNPGELEIVGGQRTMIPQGCRAGFLTNRLSPEEIVLVEVKMCPVGAPEGWHAWKTDLQVIQGGSGNLPPQMEFAVSPSADGSQVKVASRTIRGTVKVPPSATPFHAYPELLGLVVALGVVPPAADGLYEVR